MQNLVLNFGHIPSEQSTAFLKEKFGENFLYVHQRLRIDFSAPMERQIVATVDAVERQLDGKALLERCAVYILTPGLTDPSILLVIELFGRTGAFPNLLLVRREDGDFTVYDVIDGEKFKLRARGRRKEVSTLV